MKANVLEVHTSLLLSIFLISFKASIFLPSKHNAFKHLKIPLQIHFNLYLMQTSFQHTFELS